MGELLFAAGQLLCIAGLLYGAYFSITFRAEDDGPRRGAQGIAPKTQKLGSAQHPTGWERMASRSALGDL